MDEEDYINNGWFEWDQYECEVLSIMQALCKAFKLDLEKRIVDPSTDLSKVKLARDLKIIKQQEIFWGVGRDIHDILSKVGDLGQSI